MSQQKPLYYYSQDGYIRSTEPPLAGCVQGVALCTPGSTGLAHDRVSRRDFILRAVNSHAALVEACNAALEQMRDPRGYALKHGHSRLAFTQNLLEDALKLSGAENG